MTYNFGDPRQYILLGVKIRPRWDWKENPSSRPNFESIKPELLELENFVTEFTFQIMS